MINGLPSCWDGKNLDSPNHQDHVAYPTSGPANFLSLGGSCPSTHPIRIPQLMYGKLWPPFLVYDCISNSLITRGCLGHHQVQRQEPVAHRRISAILPQHRRQHRIRPARWLRFRMEGWRPPEGYGHLWLHGCPLRNPHDPGHRRGKEVQREEGCVWGRRRM